MAPKPPSYPKPDLKNLGQWLPMTRETHPENFASPEEAAENMRNAELILNRLEATRARERGEDPTATGQGDGNGDDTDKEASPEPDDDITSDYDPGQERRKRPAAKRTKGKGRAVEAPVEEDIEEIEEIEDVEEESELEDEEDLYVSSGDEVMEEDTEGDDGEEDDEDANPPADILNVNDAGWKFGNPKSLPLTYYIDADNAGGRKAKTIKFNVDFNNRESVNKANKTRRLEVNRAKKRHGILGPLKRPSTKGREYSDMNDDFISIIHEDYALQNNGQRIPMAELADRYNQHFPGENRTASSLISHIERIQVLKDMRNSYAGN